MTTPQMTLADELVLIEELAIRALSRWDLPAGAAVSLLNVSENTTFLVTADGGYRAILRIHRENYHSRAAIASELAWIDALGRDGNVTTPGYYRGFDGEAIQQISIPAMPTPRFAVLFVFLEGQAPDEQEDAQLSFKKLGAIAARCHEHVLGWQKPAGFERLTWDAETVFGPAATWGQWRDAPHVTPQIATILTQVEACVRRRLTAYGKAPERFNLIHADMRLANLLVQGNSIRVIDFDDSGWGWFMYDFAAAISFIEDDPRVPQMRSAWVQGYRSVRPLAVEDEAEIDTFIMLRRMALLAWIGSHIEAPEPQALAPTFAPVTAELGAAYLARMGADDPVSA